MSVFALAIQPTLNSASADPMIHYPRRLMNRLPISANTMLLLLAVIVGLTTGMGVALFRGAIELVDTLLIDIELMLAGSGIHPQVSGAIFLAGAGLLVGFIMQRFVGHERHHGVSGIIEAVALAGGRLPYRRAIPNTIASVLSLGAGASVGPEDPSVQIGSNLGSFLGQRLRLREEYIRLLVAAGGASAIAAAFNAPIAGVFFAMEIILREFTSTSFGIVVLAAVVASGFTRAVQGASPIFDGLSFILGNPLQLIFYALLGLLMAFVSVSCVRFFYWWKSQWGDLLKSRLKLSLPLRTALTGIVVGVVGIAFPQILGPGEAFMHEVLIGEVQMNLGLLLVLGVVKWVMTATSIGGEFFVGGVFAPTLFVGIVLGDAYGILVGTLLPQSIVGTPQTYAIAGMAGLLAGIVRAPVTAIMLVFEITDDYALILPMMLTAGICTLVMERTGTQGIYQTSLVRSGLVLSEGRDIDLMQGVTVGEAMISPAPTIHASASLRELRDAFHDLHTRALCVVKKGHDSLYGIVTLGDLQAAFERALHENGTRNNLTVGDICSTDLVTASPDEALWTAIRKMGANDIGRLPVVDMEKGELVGLLRRHDIMTAYNAAVARKLRDQHMAEQIRLNRLTGAHVLEYPVRKHTPVCGQKIKDVRWPPEAVIASIQRRGRLIVPHGDTQILPGDVLTVVADADSELLLDRMFDSGL